ncbi:putative signal transducing protein [Hamadaea tsunoensis]|uniref:hypothetical protein n=1 Tax=Hamadaea tsunoensis TaxID=53368 RepID=UPI00047F8775|nr:hypothetical protein [Hamadaea tsunoensis]
MLALDGPYVIGPVIALTVAGVLALLLHRSLTRPEPPAAAVADPHPDDFGLLVPVATCRDQVDADLVREHLRSAGIRSTLAVGPAGKIRVMVFSDALDKARKLV